MWQKLSKKLRGAIYIRQVFQKLHKKLFLEGTTKVFLEEQQQKPLFFIIMPNTAIKNFVTAVSHSLLIYTAIFVPFQVSFISDYESDTINLIDEIVNNLFIVDFFLNFITAVEIQGRIETKPKQIAKEYL